MLNRNTLAMALAATLASGCSYYFGSDDQVDEAPSTDTVALRNGCSDAYELDARMLDHAEHSVRLVGVYEAAQGSFQEHLEGEFVLEVFEPGPTTLVLSSYEPVEWTIFEGPETEVRSVIHSGYHPTRVNIAGDAEVIDLGYLGTVYDWPDDRRCEDAYSTASCADPQLLEYFEKERAADREVIARVEELVGQPLTEFYGCYRMDGLTIGDIPIP